MPGKKKATLAVVDRNRAFEWSMLLHRVKRGQAPLEDVCLRVCSDRDREMFAELVARDGSIDAVDFWLAKPEVRWKAQELVMNADGRPGAIRALEAIAARRSGANSPVRATVDLMASMLVDDEELEMRWRERGCQHDGRVARAFWRGAFRECARRAWYTEASRQRRLEFDGAIPATAALREVCDHSARARLATGLIDANGGFI